MTTTPPSAAVGHGVPGTSTGPGRPPSAGSAAGKPAWLETLLLPWALVVRPRHLPTPGRVFAAMATAGAPRPILGRGVLDEFQTLSGPLLLGPRGLVGQLYDAGLAASFARDPDMGLDAGWPSLAIGLDMHLPPAASMAESRDELVRFAAGRAPSASPLPEHVAGTTLATAAGAVDLLRVGVVLVVATGAPLLPRQLRRLAAMLIVDPATRPAGAAGPPAVVVALGAGHPLPTPEPGATLSVPFLAEAAFEAHLHAVYAGVEQV